MKIFIWKDILQSALTKKKKQETQEDNVTE